MRKDQIFVLLLIVLLPLSGCMDGAIGDADAQDSTEEEAAVVNYYYNNTTNHVQNEPTLYHLSTNSTSNTAFTITVSENEALEIVRASLVLVWDDNRSNNNPGIDNNVQVLDISCYDGLETPGYFGQASGLLWRGQGECTYTFGTNYGADFGIAYHSMYYKIHSIINV